MYSLEANQSLTVDSFAFISCTDGQPLIDHVEEAQDHRQRNWAFWQIFPLREEKEDASQLLSKTAFFKVAQKSLLGLKEAM